MCVSSYNSQQPDGVLLDPEDSFWCQALEDLETCGQSELLREIEVGDVHRQAGVRQYTDCKGLDSTQTGRGPTQTGRG